MQQSLEEVLTWPWEPIIARDEEFPDEWVARVVGLPDFAIYGAHPDAVRAAFPDALRSHLQAYIACGKVIPRPAHIAASTGADVVRTGGIGPTVAQFVDGILCGVQPGGLAPA